jgi:hypothetical protein
MLVKTSGVVLKKIPYTDHSAVVHIYTEQTGLIPFLVQGLGKSKSKAAYFQSGQLIELVFNNKQTGGLRRLKEVNLHPDNPIQLGISAQQLSFFYTELLALSLEDAQADAELFDFIKNKLCDLSQNSPQKYAPIRFVLGLCAQLGYQIDADIHFPHLEGVKSQLNAILRGEEPIIDRITRRHLLNRLVERLQIEAFPEKSVRSLDVIDALFD